MVARSRLECHHCFLVIYVLGTFCKFVWFKICAAHFMNLGLISDRLMIRVETRVMDRVSAVKFIELPNGKAIYIYK